ncbi:hypothetical protein FHS89_000292 [Rubricella aquisinus]|uniref:Sulfotransferase family protein n=1 Tax=Rubricella aquisinus TaxID=2028108 RepID=A0A840WVM0_9RHOB|nr:sulfotransferase family 2 domain-containing protein [Rubricella aquisinus]MBB5514294.1 hypothetical protein [Rubricella aquisinus]
MHSAPPHAQGAIALMKAMPGQMSTLAGTMRWMECTCYGPAQRWLYSHVGKTASSAMLRALFHIEFGYPLSVTARRKGDINPNVAMHALVTTGLFRAASDPRVNFAAVMEKRPISVVSLRHPSQRALSAFRYICRADAEGADQFLAERLRMTALHGFDWTRDPGTADGFARFLDFVGAEIAHRPNEQINPHYAPQVQTLILDKLAFDVQVRAEDMGQGVMALCDRLDLHPQPILDDLGQPNQTGAEGADWLARPDIRQRLATLYATDYEVLNYDP